MVLDIIFFGMKIVHGENNFHKRLFAKMISIESERNNSLNKITDIDFLNPSYNMILD